MTLVLVPGTAFAQNWCLRTNNNSLSSLFVGTSPNAAADVYFDEFVPVFTGTGGNAQMHTHDPATCTPTGGIYNGGPLYSCITNTTSTKISTGESSEGIRGPNYFAWCNYNCPAGQQLDSQGECSPIPVLQKEKSLGVPEQCVSNPCNPANGDKYQPENDYSNPQTELHFTRSYNSLLGKNLGMGYGWTSPFHKRLELQKSNLQVRRGDGRGEPLARDATSGVWYSSSNVQFAWNGDSDTQFTLTQDSAGYNLAYQNGINERYDNTGKLLLETSPTGQTTTYSYTSGKLSTVTGPFGHTLSFGYNASNLVATVTDSAGQVIGYLYDANSNLTRVNYPDGTAKIYHYENTAFPRHLTGISYVDAGGATTRYATYAYDTTGKASLTQHAQTDNGAPQERFTLNYDSDTQTTVTDPVGMNEVMTFATNLGVKNLTLKVNQSDGKSVQQMFDANNNLTCKKDEENRVTTYIYDSVTNQRTSMTEGLTGDCTNPANVPGVTRTTTYEYLSSTLDLPRFIRRPSVATGQTFETEMVYGDTGHPKLPTQIIQRGYTSSGTAVSRAVSLGYNSYGQVNSINGPRTDVNDVTALEYYECTTGGTCGQLKKVTNALGHITTYDQYDANGRLKQMTDANGLVTTYDYDPRGRVKTITRTPASGSAATTQYSYTPWGDVSQVIDPDGVVLNYQYDAAHDLRSIIDAAGNYIHYKYDLKGNRTGEDFYDAGGNLKRTVSQTYDSRNHLSQINNAGNITQLIHDAVGNLLSETDPNNNPATQHTPDALNRLVQTIDRLGGTTAYGYDANDRPTQVAPPGKSATQYTYDDLGNLLQEVSPDRGTANYTYDAVGNLMSQTNALGQLITYAYDALNRLTLANAPGTDFDATYVYDSCNHGIGRLCSVNNASTTASYSYDGAGNITGHQSLGYTYTAANRLSTVTYPSGAVVTYDYDNAGQANQVRLTRNGVTQVVASGIQYAPFGPVTALAYGNGKSLTQTLDTAYRIRSQITPGVLELDYPLYDANGNLRQRSEAISALSSSFIYDALDRLDTGSNPSFINFDYDANGNRTLSQQGWAVTPYSYSSNTNRLTQVGTGAVTTDASGNITAQDSRTYVYSPGFNYLTQALDNGSPVANYTYNTLNQRVAKQTGGMTTSYAYGLDGFLRVETPQGGTAREYIYLDGQPLAVIDNVNALYYYYNDHLGTPQAITDTSGTGGVAGDV
jgi:YD repeat-containing protein